MSKSNNTLETYESQEWIEVTLSRNNVPDELDRPDNDDGKQYEETSMELRQRTKMESREPI